MRRLVLAATLAIAAVLGGILWIEAQPPPPGADLPGLSFIALGDTGKPPDWRGPLSPALRVARAVVREDRRAPIDALVLLGDNFYPSGLHERELVEQLQQNLVGPYCRFIDLSPLGKRMLGSACNEADAARHPVPIVAVLGNHDVETPEGAALQIERLPELVSNWRMPAEVSVLELAPGLSLITLDSQAIADGGDLRAFRAALQRAQGPWRLVAAHHPIVDAGDRERSDYPRRMAEAIASAGVPVQVFFAGHVHSLQVLRGDGAALHVVSGGGSDARPVGPTGAERLFGSAELGFVRVDAPGPGAEPPASLEITLFAICGSSLGVGTPRARFRLALDGSVERLAPAGDR
jgi:predicted phosphodiesterase